MLLPTGTLINYLDQLAPRSLAFEWDNVGLQLGDAGGKVKTILVSLDIDSSVLKEAVSLGADFIVTHHPLIFRPLRSLRTDQPLGRLLADALAAGIRVFVLHTNLDVASAGVSDALADLLGISETQVIRTTGQEDLEKITVFVPTGHEDNVRQAMSAAGAGWVGNYSHCTFQVPGTGTFLPMAGTNPFIGQQGKLEKVEEVRIETIIPASKRKHVIQAMLKAHPYEETAYDIYPLHNEGATFGLGRIGKIDSPCTLAEFCGFIKEKMNIRQLRVTGDPNKTIEKVAVCGGAGADLIHAASFAGADVLVTGDIKYHDARDAGAIGLALIDAGHDATESVVIPTVCTYLKNKIKEGGYVAKVLASATETTPWWVL
ncbi:MAG: Nif3-like dinuclear metal center hexameric protein [Dethiobacter sp.]|nr:Nif3-like dinuclear metal center hexameric protein [Dethiobacter sp.]